MGKTSLFGLLLAAPLVFACSSATTNPGTDNDGGTPGVDGGGPGPDGSGPGPDGAGPGPDGSKPGPDGSTGGLQYSNSVQIIVEPSDNGDALVAAINGATTSVHMTMYLLSSTPVMDALIAQQNAGHEVKVILNQNFPGGQGTNSSSFSQLKSAGVQVVWANPGFTYTHEKCVIIDKNVAWIMTMNATQSSPTSNREYLAIDSDAADVAEAEGIFQGDFTNQSSSTNGALLVAPTNARPRLITLIQSATSTIDLEGEELSDYLIVGELIAAKNRGVTVHITLASGTGSASQQTAIGQLKGAGIPLVSVSNPIIHAKALVADGARAYVGSENFSTGSLQYNRELGLVTNKASEVTKVRTTIASDFASGSPL